MLFATNDFGQGIFVGFLIMFGVFLISCLITVHITERHKTQRLKAMRNCALANDYVSAIATVIPYTSTKTTGPDEFGKISISTVWSTEIGTVECQSLPVEPIQKSAMLPAIQLKVTKGSEGRAVSSCGGEAWDTPEEFAQSLLALLKSIGYEIPPESELELVAGFHALPPAVAIYLEAEPAASPS